MTGPAAAPGNGMDFSPDLMTSLDAHFVEMATLFRVPMMGQPNPLYTVTAFIQGYVRFQSTDFTQLRRNVLTASRNHSQAADALDVFMRFVRPLLAQGIDRRALAYRLSDWFMEVSRRPLVSDVPAASLRQEAAPVQPIADVGAHVRDQVASRIPS